MQVNAEPTAQEELIPPRQLPPGAIPVASGGYIQPWKPGQSGNPGGRSRRFVEVQALCRDASPDAAKRLIELVQNEDERVAIIACNSILDRAFGKPKEQKDDSNQPLRPNLSALSPSELTALRGMLARMAGTAENGSAAQDIDAAPQQAQVPDSTG